MSELTVMNVISQPAFQGAAVVGGWTGLKHQVTAPTVAEVPDSAQWLAGGELVLSTAYLVRTDPEGFVRWVRSLAEYGAAALAVKPQRFLGSLPADVMREADRLGFPLIALPYSVHWPELIKPMSAAILHSTQGLLPETHLARFTTLLEQPAGFMSVCQSLASLLDCAVVFSDVQGQVLGLGLPPHEAEAHGHIVKDFINNRQRLRDWPLPPRPDGTDAWYKPLGSGFALQMHPVVVQGNVRGSLSLVSPRFPLSAEKQAIADAWLAALALTYERLSNYHESPPSERSGELQRLLRGTSTTLPGADHPLTIALSTPGFVATIGLDSGDRLATVSLQSGPESGAFEVADKLFVLLEDWLRQHDPLGAVTVVDGRPVIVAHATDAETWGEELRGFLTSHSSSKHVLLAIGGRASELSSYRRSLAQAQGVLRLTQLDGTRQGVRLYQRMGLRRLLADLNDLAQVKAFGTELLAPLLQADPSLHLLETLSAYLRADGRIPPAAEALFVHPNTVRYRLRRIEALTGMNLQSIDHQAQLLLALHIHELVGHRHSPPVDTNRK